MYDKVHWGPYSASHTNGATAPNISRQGGYAGTDTDTKPYIYQHTHNIVEEIATKYVTKRVLVAREIKGEKATTVVKERYYAFK